MTELARYVPAGAGPWRTKRGPLAFFNIHCCKTSKKMKGEKNW